MHYFEAESQKFFCGGGTAPSTAQPLPKLDLLRRLQRLAPYLPTPQLFFHNSHTAPSHNRAKRDCITNTTTVLSLDTASSRSSICRSNSCWLLLPRCMECRPSGCSSVCQTRELGQNGRKICPDFSTTQKII